MSHTTTSRGGLVVIALALSSLTLSACGDQVAPPAAATSKVAFDRALHDQLPQAIRDAGSMRVATDASYAPMSFFGPDGRTIVGMEPDLADDLGRVLGVKLAFVNTDFTEIFDAVTAGDADLGISAFTDTPEREKLVDFVNYFNAGTSIVVQRGNPSGVSDVKDLCGKIVAVEEGTTQVDLLQRAQANCGVKPMKVKTYPTNSDALVQLRTGRAAAVLNDFPPASYLVNDAKTKAHYQLAATTQYEPGLYGVAIAKGQPGLRDAVQGALETLVRDGAYADILGHWGVQGGGIDQITVNSGR